MTTTIDDLPDPQDTRTEMTRLSARGYVQIRHILVQIPDRALAARGSTLGRVVGERRHRALLLYLLLLTCWPWLSTRNQPLPATTWIRGLTAAGAQTWSPSTLSRAWGDLEDLGLLEERTREARAVRVVPRREDGEEPYDAPAGRRTREHAYFVLPDSFWKEELFAKLTLPGLAMLLITAKDTNDAKRKEMYLPLHKAQEWYGISGKTVQNGLSDLERHDLLHRREERLKAPLSATGWTTRVWYSLTGEYGAEARAALRKKARTERKARIDGKSSATLSKPRKKGSPPGATVAVVGKPSKRGSTTSAAPSRSAKAKTVPVKTSTTRSKSGKGESG